MKLLKPKSRDSAAAKRRRHLAPKWILFVSLVASAPAHATEPPSKGLRVWDFATGITNRWGGRYNAYMREPSWARTYLDPQVTRTSSGHSLRVTVHREAEGFCGLWMDFHPASESPRRYLDASPYRFLSFWIKGQKGGEDFEIQLSDDTALENEGAQPKRPLRAYLPQGATTQWQEVVIPLVDFRGLNLRRLSQLTLNFTTPGDYRFNLDTIALKADRVTMVADPNPTPVEARSGPTANSPRAMWVWNTKALFGRKQMDRFLRFCAQHNVREVYLAFEIDHSNKEAAPQSEVRDPARYREILVRAHQRGLKVEGLLGTPEWAVRENHALALAAVNAALSFNRLSPPEARLDGVHFDVEPYALIGYADPQYRPQILEEFLEMVSQCAARLRLEPDLGITCDVPAWFYATDGLDRQRLMVAFGGKEKAVGEHLTDLLDVVTIMDYYNQADGAGGIIARGTASLKYAASMGKKIRVGLETFAEPDTSVYFVRGFPLEEFGRRLAASGLRNRLFFDGFRLAVLSDEVNIHVGLAAPAEMTTETQVAFEKALAQLAHQLGVPSRPQPPTAPTVLEVAQAALAQNWEWKGLEPFEFTEPGSQRPIKGFRAVRRMPARTTFHGLAASEFEEESRSVAEWLGRLPSFAGLAIHFYDSFRTLMEQQK